MTAVGMTAAAAAGAQVNHCGHSGATLNPANAVGFTIEAALLAQDMFTAVDMQLAVEQYIERQVEPRTAVRGLRQTRRRPDVVGAEYKVEYGYEQ